MASSLTLSFFAQWGGMIQHAKRVQHHTPPGKNPEPRQHHPRLNVLRAPRLMPEPLRVAQCAFKPFKTSGELFGVGCQNSTACEAQRQRLAACLLPLSVFALADNAPLYVPEAQGSLDPGHHAMYVRRSRTSLGCAARTARTARTVAPQVLTDSDTLPPMSRRLVRVRVRVIRVKLRVRAS